MSNGNGTDHSQMSDDLALCKVFLHTVKVGLSKLFTPPAHQQICLQLGTSALLTIKSEKPQEGLHGGIWNL